MLLPDPGEDRGRVGDDRPVWELQRRQLLRSGRLAQLLTRAFAQERNRTAVGGDHLVVLDVRGMQRFLHAATWMDPRAAFIAVANEQCRGPRHFSSSVVDSDKQPTDGVRWRQELYRLAFEDVPFRPTRRIRQEQPTST